MARKPREIKGWGASERDGDALEWPGDGHSERMVLGGST